MVENLLTAAECSGLKYLKKMGRSFPWRDFVFYRSYTKLQSTVSIDSHKARTRAFEVMPFFPARYKTFLRMVHSAVLQVLQTEVSQVLCKAWHKAWHPAWLRVFERQCLTSDTRSDLHHQKSQKFLKANKPSRLALQSGHLISPSSAEISIRERISLTRDLKSLSGLIQQDSFQPTQPSH